MRGLGWTMGNDVKASGSGLPLHIDIGHEKDG